MGKGRSYRLIGRELGLSKNTVSDIVKRRTGRRKAVMRGALRKSGYAGGVDPLLP